MIVSGKLAVRSADRDTSTPAVPASLVGAIRAIPGVAAVGGEVEGTATLIDRNGKAIGVDGPPKLGLSVPTPGLTGLRLVSGRWPHAGEVAIDRFTASDEKVGVGDSIGVATNHPTRRYRIAGLVQLAGVGASGATISVFDLRTAQAILDRPGEVDTIRVRAEDGVSPAELVRRVEAAQLQAPVTLRVETAKAHAERTMHEQLGFIDIFRYILLAFGGVALLVGAFIIYNTFAITVAQRVRELALLRCLGATRRQALVSVLAEGLAIGAVASLIGTGAGIALGAGLIALFNAMGLTIPAGADRAHAGDARPEPGRRHRRHARRGARPGSARRPRRTGGEPARIRRRPQPAAAPLADRRAHGARAGRRRRSRSARSATPAASVPACS